MHIAKLCGIFREMLLFKNHIYLLNMTSFLYYYCENKVKSHLSTLCWGEGRNLRDGYLQISADKSQSCTLDSTFIIQGNRPIKPQNWNVSSIHLPLWKYTFGHGSHLHHSSRVNSFRVPDLHPFPLDGNKHLDWRLTEQSTDKTSCKTSYYVKFAFHIWAWQPQQSL